MAKKVKQYVVRIERESVEYSYINVDAVSSSQANKIAEEFLDDPDSMKTLHWNLGDAQPAYVGDVFLKE